MNNSLRRLIDGMVATLRLDVIPQIGTEFARGQAFGVIYLLNSIALRAEWSAAFYREQLTAQTDLRQALLPLVEGLDSPELPQPATLVADSTALETQRDANESRVCELIVWLADNQSRIEKNKANAIDAALRAYINRQLKFELSTSAKPMFAEISRGAE